ncbi:MAG: dockerin type I repeat-containing protein [Lacipirellulaceae bacterium]
MRLTKQLLCAWAAVAGWACPSVGLADQPFSIVVDPRTGATSLRNDGTTTIAIDGYLLRSASSQTNPAALNVAGWDNIGGAFASTATGANRIGETNLSGSLSVGPGATVSIGSAYTPFAPTAVGQPEPTFDFAYSVAGVGAAVGDVEFSRRNTVVLVVNSTTGAATLQNQSAFPVQLDGYLLTSSAGVLNPSGWTTLQSSLGGGGGWQSGASAANRMVEGKLVGSTLLAPNGGSLSIGLPISPSLLTDETQLRLEYSVAGVGELLGGVQFLPLPVVAAPGDYNRDGRVNAADYTVWRDSLGSTSNLAADGNGSGSIDSGDYTVWVSNYGSGAGSATAVPEPVSVVLLISAATAVVGRRRA